MARKIAAAIRIGLKTRGAIKRLRGFMNGVQGNDFKAWRRAKAILGYIEGQSVIELSKVLDVTRGSINRWLQWYNAMGIDGLRTIKPEGRPPRLNAKQIKELVVLIETGPQEAGFDGGVWTGPMVAHLIKQRYLVKYHHHHIPRLLHNLGFSVQRPRKRLARADMKKQAIWQSQRLPAIKKKPPHVEVS
jgi:transposase